MATAIIVLILLMICVYGVRSYAKKITRGGGCCGEHETPDKKVKVTDRDKSHYS